MNTTQQIALGTRIHCILYGGKDGTITAIHGEAQPDTIIAFPGFGLTTGGNAEYDVIWDNLTRSPRVPECIIRGVQWRILEEPRASDQRILELIDLAHRKQESDRIAEQEKRAALAARRDQLILDHPALEVGNGSKIAAKNIRAQLKQAFGWLKFSVRSDHNSVNIGWTDGPTVEQVEEITAQYKEGRYDGMNDCYDYDQDRVWPFGGTTYLFTRRDISEETRADAIKIIAQHYHESCDLEQERYRCLRRTTIPAGHRLTGMHGETFTTTAP